MPTQIIKSLKMKSIRAFETVLLLFISFGLYSQTKSYKSSEHTVTKANGNPTLVTKNKTMYIEIWLRDVCKGNDCGSVTIADGPLHTGQQINYEQFRIYTVKLKEDGVYNYWTTDIGNDGQTVLFQVDNNGAVPTMTMHRYAPGEDSKVLKSIIYNLE